MVNKTKAQLAREIYGTALVNLSAGQKAAITKAFNAQNAFDDDDDYVEEAEESSTGILECKIGRPGVNGLKASLVPAGTTVKGLFDQSGLSMKPEKEGFIVKSSNHYTAGKTLKNTDLVYDGDVIAIVPGVDSNGQ